MTIRKFLDCSTCHITEEDAKALDQGALPLTIYPHPDGYGWFIYVPPEDRVVELSDAMNALLAHARQHDCDYICLDNAGSEIEGLQTFDW